MTQRFHESTCQTKDATFEVPLRPRALGDFVGQAPIRERLEIYMGAALKRKEPLSHCLFCGPPGLGKTTLANIIAHTMGGNLVTTSGPALDKPADLAGVLSNLQEGDILFIDEIHRLSRVLEEYLYPAMEDFQLDLVIDSGPAARSVQIPLAKFTLVGATTRLGLLTGPLRSRFGLTCRLEFYTADELATVVQRTARILGLELPRDAALEIAKRSRGTPRIANHLVRWVRDYYEMQQRTLDVACVRDALGMLAINESGLDELDIKLLRVLIEQYEGAPVGLSTLSAVLGEEASTIEEVVEPFLIQEGFIKRGPRGREATDLAYRHLARIEKEFLC